MASQNICQRLTKDAETLAAGTELSVLIPEATASFMPALLPKVRQVIAVNTQATTPNINQPAAAFHCKATIPLASTPLMAIPAPGPVNIKPPRLLALRSARRARHQADVNTKTNALATPAAKRSHGHSAGTCRAMPNVKTQVATKPPRSQVVDSTGGQVLILDQISG